MNKANSLTVGQKIKYWTVINPTPIKRLRGTSTKSYVSVRCECGIVREIVIYDLLSPNTHFSCYSCAMKRNGLRQIGLDNPYWKGIGKVPGNVFTTIRKQAKQKGLAVTITHQYISQLFNEQNENVHTPVNQYTLLIADITNIQHH